MIQCLHYLYKNVHGLSLLPKPYAYSFSNDNVKLSECLLQEIALIARYYNRNDDDKNNKDQYAAFRNKLADVELETDQEFCYNV